MELFADIIHGYNVIQGWTQIFDLICNKDESSIICIGVVEIMREKNENRKYLKIDIKDL